MASDRRGQHLMPSDGDQGFVRGSQDQDLCRAVLPVLQTGQTNLSILTAGENVFFKTVDVKLLNKVFESSSELA